MGDLPSRRTIPRRAPADVYGHGDRMVPLEPLEPATGSLDPSLSRTHRRWATCEIWMLIEKA